MITLLWIVGTLTVLNLGATGCLIYFYKKLIKLLPPESMVWIHGANPASVVEVGDVQQVGPLTFDAHLMDETETGVEHEVVIRSGKPPQKLRYQGGEYIRTRLSPEDKHIYRRCGTV